MTREERKKLRHEAMTVAAEAIRKLPKGSAVLALVQTRQGVMSVVGGSDPDSMAAGIAKTIDQAVDAFMTKHGTKTQEVTYERK